MFSIDYKDKGRFHLSLGVVLIIGSLLLFLSSLLVIYEKMDSASNELASVIPYCDIHNNETTTQQNLTGYCYYMGDSISNKINILDRGLNSLKIIGLIGTILGALSFVYGYYLSFFKKE